MSGRRVGTAGVVVAALPLLGGCAGGLELAALGAVANAAKTGGTAMKFGKVDMALMTTPEVVADAVYASFDELGFRVFSDATSEDGFRREIVSMNPRGHEYKFVIKPVSDGVTFVRLDIGLFGSNPVGQLIAQRLRVNLGFSGVEAEPA
ncbi:hypothetical protein [Phycisphaera mikurensis]|nr:hypothetical protein [Phycisphaera mikurensis]MBB6441790.1 hypothetical protein [Phycisphaera mikurensis]